MKSKVRAMSVATSVCAALMLSAAATAQTPEGPPQGVIVKWKTNTSVSATAFADVAVQSLDRAGSRMGVSMRRVRPIATGAEVINANRRMTRAELNDVINSLKNDPNVEYVEEDTRMYPTFVPNDTRYAEQWGYYEATGGINLPPAWDIVTGQGVRVAVLDTGYRPHVDLAANIVGGYDFISNTFTGNDGNGRDNDARDPGDAVTASDCGDGRASNSSWHGTHVAGTIAAVTNNGSGVAGVAFGAKVVPVRVLGKCGGSTSDIADAIIWASGGAVSGVPANPNPARVINMSLGGRGTCNQTTQNAINSARSRGTVVVVAAGNDNANAANFNPSSCQGVINVAAVGRNGGKASYSNFGAVVDVAAPGGSGSGANNILSTLNAGTNAPGADNFQFYAGTSMATPHVAGVVALMLSRNTQLTPDVVETRLKGSTRAFAATCSQCGTGIVNALAAVNAAGGGTTTPPPPTPGQCPAGFSGFTGQLTTGSSLSAPAGGVAANAGLLQGRLTGPANTDFDLYLQRRGNNGAWTAVAGSEGQTSTEAIDFNGAAATYRWIVYSYRGNGAMSLCIKTP
jgi:serine protease